MSAKYTIGIATLDDFEGLWWTVHTILSHHVTAIGPEWQLVVIDQNPDSDHGAECANLVVKKLKRRIDRLGCLHSAKYVPMRAPRGIGVARNRIFAEAAGDWVLCLDSHVLLYPEALAEFAKLAPTIGRDLLVGPLVSESGGYVGTHQELVWRREALGIWETDERGTDWNHPPFDVPSQGLGMFACRRDAFPGFHPQQRGFGSAEAMFCERFRARGDRVLCVPRLRWLHRFVRIGGPPYECLTVDKVANYLLEMLSHGLDTSGLCDHFEGKLNDAEVGEINRRLEAAGLPHRIGENHGAGTTAAGEAGGADGNAAG